MSETTACQTSDPSLISGKTCKRHKEKHVGSLDDLVLIFAMNIGSLMGFDGLGETFMGSIQGK
ncbi:hypothetical protein GCM10011591_07390 [Nocardia camponoti]|uniref:Uncharacterized protein n=1 Tax=Nocardia camponoti TaxID=1616106 RepID=A0A917Q9X7_9NOCA|nr:hypothetical protein GCM10011591_07390 [Nocardia camponoti]